jgi:hypothetical protein
MGLTPLRGSRRPPARPFGLLPKARRGYSKAVTDLRTIADGDRVWRLALLALFAGCSVAHSSRSRPLVVDARSGAGGVVISADRAFGTVACSYRAAAEPVDSAKSYRMVWWAQCPKSAHCTDSVRYGEESPMITNDGPAPLAPGICYTCLLDGDGGGGHVNFSVGPDGSVSRCDPNPAP